MGECTMKTDSEWNNLQSFSKRNRIWAALLGCAALVWFLLRVGVHGQFRHVQLTPKVVDLPLNG